MDDGCCFVDMIHELCWPSQVEGIDSQLIPGCLFALQLWRNTTKHRKEGENLRVFMVVLAAKNVPTSRSLVVVFTPQNWGEDEAILTMLQMGCFNHHLVWLVG